MSVSRVETINELLREMEIERFMCDIYIDDLGDERRAFLEKNLQPFTAASMASLPADAPASNWSPLSLFR